MEILDLDKLRIVSIPQAVRAVATAEMGEGELISFSKRYALLQQQGL